MYFSDYSSLSEFSHLDRGINRAPVSCPDFGQKKNNNLKCCGKKRTGCRSYVGRESEFSIVWKGVEMMWGINEEFITNYMPPGW